MNLSYQFEKTRSTTEKIIYSCEMEDLCIQPYSYVSPPKWHLAHTTWFFETFVLRRFKPDFKPFDESFDVLFNSYYRTEGTFWEQSRRGALSRPTIKQILSYRNYVTENVLELLQGSLAKESQLAFCNTVKMGIEHEKQHQELLFMDLKAILSLNPSKPFLPYCLPEATPHQEKTAYELKNQEVFTFGIQDGSFTNSANPGAEFCFDNETPAHQVVINPFKLQIKPVTCGEYAAFLDSKDYDNPSLWLSDGYDYMKKNKIHMPEYWVKQDNLYHIYDIHQGLLPLSRCEDEPVCHISYYEADAYATWTGKRLPSEYEYELACRNEKTPNTKGLWHNEYMDPNKDSGQIDRPNSTNTSLIGWGWSWTNSAYQAYPGYKKPTGAMGEYNGKFMVNQMVLKGGSLFTPVDHYRMSYRNFYRPFDRWQRSGLHLAEDQY